MMAAVDPRAHARNTDPGTSHAAARRLSPKTTMMRRLLWAFHDRALTAEEAADICGYGPESGAWKRVSDLAVLGWIEDTGSTRPARSGRQQMVRRITDDGRRELWSTEQ